jgi:hypothetical protein
MTKQHVTSAATDTNSASTSVASTSTSGTSASTSAAGSNIFPKPLNIEHIYSEITKELFGVEEQTRSSLNKINVYINMPGLIREPLILNYWGPTGSGKTQLVRQIVKHINYKDRFHYINLANPSSRAWKNFKRKIRNAVHEDVEKATGVDIAELLEELDGDDSSIYNYQTKESVKGFHPYSESVGEETEEKVNLIELIESRSSDLKRKKGIGDVKNASELLEPVILFFDEFQHIKSLNERGDEVQATDTGDIWGILDHGLEYLVGFHVPTIIFIAGNVNLSSVESVQNWMGTPDEDNSETSPSIHTIHIALSRRFRPEMIARLRNDHYFFKPIDKKRAKQIIQRELDLYKEVLHSKADIPIVSYDSSFIDFLFEMATSKGLGARGIESIVTHSVKSNTGNWIMEVLSKGYQLEHITEVSLKGKEDQVNITIHFNNGEHLLFEYLVRPPRKRPSNPKPEEIAIYAVHEAGHALAGYVLNGLAPEYLTLYAPKFATGTSGGIKAYVKYDDDYEYNSRQKFLQQISVGLSGYLAEKIIFGQDHVTTGSGSDLDGVQKLVEDYVLDLGFGQNMMKRIVENSYINDPHPLMNSADRAEMEVLIAKGRDIAMYILESQREALEMLAKVSFIQGIVKKDAFIALMDRFIDRKRLLEYLQAKQLSEQDFEQFIHHELASLTVLNTSKVASKSVIPTCETESGTSVVELLKAYSYSYSKALFGDTKGNVETFVLYGLKPADEQDPQVLNTLMIGNTPWSELGI